MREKGNAVIPNAPQHANIGYPIRQRRPIRKQGMVVVISIVSLAITSLPEINGIESYSRLISS